MIDYKLPGWERSAPGRYGRQDYSCHKCPVMQQSHKQFFFSPEPMNNSSHPKPLLLLLLEKPNACRPPCPHQPPAFPSCAQAHPCQHKTQSSPQDPWTLEEHSWPLILSYLCLTVHMKWWSRVTHMSALVFFTLIKNNQSKEHQSERGEEASHVLRAYYFKMSKVVAALTKITSKKSPKSSTQKKCIWILFLKWKSC